MERRKFLRQSVITMASASSLNSIFYSCKNSSDSGLSAENLFSMQNAWVNDAEFIGYFVAIEKKFYEKEGLNFSYREGGPEIIPEGKLISKDVELALTTPDTTANLIINEGAPLKIIGTQYQKSPLGIVSLAEKPIKTPEDLVGKRLAVPAVNILSAKALLKLNGIPEGEVELVPYAYDPTPLILGEIDATIDFATNVPFTIEQMGKKPYSFYLADFGFYIFNDTIVVREETLKSKRNEIIAWLRASKKGWEENFRDTTKYPNKFMESYFKGNNRSLENELAFNEKQKSLIESPAGIFSMTEEDIDKNIQSLNAIGIKATRNMFVTDLHGEI